MLKENLFDCIFKQSMETSFGDSPQKFDKRLNVQENGDELTKDGFLTYRMRNNLTPLPKLDELLASSSSFTRTPNYNGCFDTSNTAVERSLEALLKKCESDSFVKDARAVLSLSRKLEERYSEDDEIFKIACVGSERERATSRLSHETRDLDWIGSLPDSEKSRLLEGEIMKRQLLERKLVDVERLVVSLEQRLSVGCNLIHRQTRSVQPLHNAISRLLEQYDVAEQCRTDVLRRVVEMNKRLNERLERLAEYRKVSDQDLKISRDRIVALEMLVDQLQKVKEEQLFELQMNVKKLEASVVERDCLSDRLCCAEKVNSHLQDQLCKLEREFATEKRRADKTIMDAKMDKEMAEGRLKKLEATLIEKEEKYSTEVERLTGDFKKKNKDFIAAYEKQRRSEIGVLQSSWDAAIEELRAKCRQLTFEKHHLKQRLNEIQGSFDSRHQAMCSELRERLSIKYYELMCEISDNPSTSTGEQHSQRREDSQVMQQELLDEICRLPLITSSTLRDTGEPSSGHRYSSTPTTAIRSAVPVSSSQTYRLDNDRETSNAK